MRNVFPLLIAVLTLPTLSGFTGLPQPVKPEPLAVAAADKAMLKKCLGLRKCRSAYTGCFNRIEKKFPVNQWNAEREKCVASYKVCIDKTFTGNEMFFTRWFVRQENCDQYR